MSPFRCEPAMSRPACLLLPGVCAAPAAFVTARRHQLTGTSVTTSGCRICCTDGRVPVLSARRARSMSTCCRRAMPDVPPGRTSRRGWRTLRPVTTRARGGDLALERGWSFDPPPVPSGRRVLVIGAGPSGLSAAYHLARRGHQVEIRDAGERPGGMMRYSIPAYRMPPDVLDGELDRIAALGVRISCGAPGGGPGR